MPNRFINVKADGLPFWHSSKAFKEQRTIYYALTGKLKRSPEYTILAIVFYQRSIQGHLKNLTINSLMSSITVIVILTFSLQGNTWYSLAKQIVLLKLHFSSFPDYQTETKV